MAGFSKLYCIGGLGGHQGADGINPIEMQIWVGDSGRQWLEARYFRNGIKPIADLKMIIPRKPNHPDNLLDACIAFYPRAFRECKSLAKVRRQLKGVETLDFDLDREEIPDSWYQLREEAREPLLTVNIFEANLLRVNPKKLISV